MAKNPWDNDPIVRVRDPRQNEREQAETRYRNVTGDPNPLARPVILPGEEGYAGEGRFIPDAGVVVRDAPWANDPVLTESQVRAEEIARQRVAQSEALQSGGGALEQGAMLGFADELAGLVAGAGQGASNIVRRATGQPVEVGAYDLRQALTGAVRDEQQRFAQERPFSNAALQLAGGVLIGGVGGAGRSVAQQAVVGGAYGLGAGLGGAEGTFAERLPKAAPAAVAGAVTGGLIRAGANRVTPGIAGNTPPSPVAERVMASQRAGIEPTLAGSGGPYSQRLSGILRGNIVSAGPLARAAERSREQTLQAVDTVASQYGGSEGRETAGQVLRRASQRGADQLRTESSALYEPLQAVISNPTPIPLSNARKALDESLSVFTTPELRDWFGRNATSLTEFRDLLSRSNDMATFAEARQLRSIIGSMLDDPEVFRSTSQAGLRRLYGALSDDLTQGARELGGEEAVNALSRATTFNRAARDRADRVLSNFYNTDNASQAYETLLATARATGRRSDWAQLRQLRDSVDPQDWNEIGSGIIRSLGGEGEDLFSPAKFVTEWDKLTPQARRVLFGGEGRSREFADLNNLVRVLRDQKAAGRFYNFSESGNAAGNLAGGGAVVAASAALGAGNPVPLIAVLGGAGLMRGAAEFLTSPGVARWLSGASRYAVRDGDRLARSNPDFARFWSANRNAIVQVVNSQTQQEEN